MPYGLRVYIKMTEVEARGGRRTSSTPTTINEEFGHFDIHSKAGALESTFRRPLRFL